MPFIGQEPLTGAYHVLDAITASATATYNLQLNSGAFSPATANQLLVSLNGVIQKPGSSFTISGSQITFSSALTSSDSIDFIIALGDVLSVGTPTDGSVATAKIAPNAVTDAKIAGMAASKLTGAMPALDGSALTNMGGDIAFSVRQSSDQTLTRASWVHITGMTAEDYDTSSVWASNSFTVPAGKAGLYLLYGQISHYYVNIGGDGEYGDARWYKNGTGLSASTRQLNMDSNGRHIKELAAQTLVLVDLAVGDVMKLYGNGADNNGSGNHITNGSNTYAFGYRVKAA